MSAAGYDQTMPMPSGQSSLSRLNELQDTTRETVGVLMDRLRPLLKQYPEKPVEEISVPALSGLGEMVQQQERILAMLNRILNDLDV